ncbi:MAG: NTP transferase domain-containing protein [Chlorobi bacterium]|nr:NTP transferase domain-containing protein [Chlorobiota bacterium]
MRAIIPAAGFGKRLKPHTYSQPKVLLNVGGKPILGHILDRLLDENITKATLILGYLGEQIKNYVTDNYPEVEADFVFQEDMLGLGHAIHTAAHTFDDEELFIILGDTVFDVNLGNVFTKKTTSLGVKEVTDPRRFGVALLENGIIKKLIEKPKEPVSNLALVGLYYVANSKLLAESLEELIAKDIRTNNEYQLTDALQLMIDKGEKVTTFPVEGWYDCGKPETLLSTNQFLLSQNGKPPERKDVVVIPPVFIAENAEVKNSVIGPFTTISQNCVIEDSIIKNSIIGSEAKVFASILENSIIGSNAVVRGTYKKINAGDSSELEFF